MNVCPDNCVEELNDIYELVMSDMPNGSKIEDSIGDEENKGAYWNLKVFVADRNNQMAEDM